MLQYQREQMDNFDPEDEVVTAAERFEAEMRTLSDAFAVSVSFDYEVYEAPTNES